MAQPYRHGDVILKPSNQLKGQAHSYQDFVLAEGEATGHAHRLSGDFDILANRGQILGLRVKGKTKLDHEEHGAIDLEPGDYAVDQERQLDTDNERAYALVD